ncbi:hypothetical protein [Nocardioides alkalitolerans]|uniref:hypothetical protein n=1 Tax=Nocardioides alkalitolerans TaxID=281714 RepID=UPI0004244C99|nr:hypothetical protein [Nocardioides alkalitolerans]
MFVHHCTACNTRQLTFESQFTSATPVDGGFVATFTCWCGDTGQTWVSPGADAADAEAVLGSRTLVAA